jgi:hypothetical protein
MAALIQVKPNVDWTSSGGLFDWTLEFLISRLADRDVAGWMQTVVDNNLGSIWVTEFPAATRDEIFRLLRTELIQTAQRELPDSSAKADALSQLQVLVDLTYRDA